MYGPAVSMSSLANIRVGGPPDINPVSFRFRSEHSGDIATARIFLQAGSGYSGGNGGQYRITISSDDGTSNHVPGSKVLARATFAPGNTSSVGYLVQFDAPARVTQGQLYHLVVTNIDPSPASNYISLNNLYLHQVPSGQWRPRWKNTDWSSLYRIGDTWTLKSGWAPILDLGFTDGHHEGNGYMEISRTGAGQISGRSMVRESFTVRGGDRVVTGVGIRLQRVGGMDPLTARLERSDGSVIAQASIAATAIPLGASTGYSEDSAWVEAAFPSPVTIQQGTTYRLRLSTPAGTEYAAWAIREGSQYHYDPATYFSDGQGQYTSDGSSWSSLGQVSGQQDLQFYLSTRE